MPYGGEGGIRTPDTVARMPHFECGGLNHSPTSPDRRPGARGAKPSDAFSVPDRVFQASGSVAADSTVRTAMAIGVVSLMGVSLFGRLSVFGRRIGVRCAGQLGLVDADVGEHVVAQSVQLGDRLASAVATSKPLYLSHAVLGIHNAAGRAK
jgi:hypothetical protein